jgi:hypothetical protein
MAQIVNWEEAFYALFELESHHPVGKPFDVLSSKVLSKNYPCPITNTQQGRDMCADAVQAGKLLL